MWLLLIQTNALNSSNKRDHSTRAHLFRELPSDKDVALNTNKDVLYYKCIFLSLFAGDSGTALLQISECGSLLPSGKLKWEEKNIIERLMCTCRLDEEIWSDIVICLHQQKQPNLNLISTKNCIPPQVHNMLWATN